jgi:hypothetical protein
MDPVGIAIGVVGLARLASICVDAFQEASKADAEHGVWHIRFTIQRDRFVLWARRAGLLREQREAGHFSKLETDHAEIGQTVQQIFETLRKISFLEDDHNEVKSGTEGHKTPDPTVREAASQEPRKPLRVGHQRQRKLPWDDDDTDSKRTHPGYSLKDFWITSTLLTSAERELVLQRLVADLTCFIDKLELYTAQVGMLTRPRFEIDITELSTEASSSVTPSTAEPVEAVPDSQPATEASSDSHSATEAVVQAVIDNFDRQLDIETGQPQQPPVPFSQRLRESIKEEIRTRPVSLSVASVASVTGVVSMARTFG